MRFRILIFTLAIFSFMAQVYGDINGYLSFDYSKGQEQTTLSKGMFHKTQLGLIFSGEISNEIDYLAEMRFQEGTKFDIEQAWVALGNTEGFSLKLGLYLVPFGKYNQSNRAHQTALINTPLNIDQIFPTRWRDVGCLIEGRFSSIFYSAYIGNGLSESQTLKEGQQFKDDNANKGIGGRIGMSLGQGLDVAYSHYRGKFDEKNTRNLSLQGLDIMWVAQGIYILGEYTRAQIENPEGYSSGKAEGYFIQVSFDIDTLRPVACYQRLNYTDEYHGPGFMSPLGAGNGISLNKSRWAVGVNYFAHQNVLFKLEYAFNREKEIEIKDNVFTAQVALSF